MTETAVADGGVIGILGGGQLGLMLAQAAKELGFCCHIYCPDPDSPAFAVADGFVVAAYEDQAALEDFARQSDVITYEFENVPAETVAVLAALAPVRPDRRALETAQDRLKEKQFLNDLGLATAPYAAVDGRDELEAAVARLGRPAILKARRFGYDGKGQVRIGLESDLVQALAQLAGKAAIVEAFIEFDKEISVIVVRALDGQVACYTPGENVHQDHILATTTVPASVPETLLVQAGEMAVKIVRALDYVGVMGVEMFVGADHDLLINEIAPRVHNSGHWTMDGCAVSQFHQHIRAITGQALGSTERHSDVVMHNLIGDGITRAAALAAEGGVVHFYGKKETRPGRKMGHVNFVKALS